MTPVKYHHSSGGHSAAVKIYGDGSVVVSTGGCEIGQGLFTKVIHAASYGLSKCGLEVPVSQIRHMDTDTEKHTKMGMTGGSTTSEAACGAVLKACEEVCSKFLMPQIKILEAKKAKNPQTEVTWAEVVKTANGSSEGIMAFGTFSPSDTDKAAKEPGNVCGEYENYGAACSEVEIDPRTGESTILRTDILYDCGKSLNPAIDLGQAEGAFMMGVGFVLREQHIVGEDGHCFTEGTWEYKPPCSLDVPRTFNVKFLENSTFERGVLGSKASGEPPLVLASSVYAAVRSAVAAARPADKQVFDLNLPATVERIMLACNPK